MDKNYFKTYYFLLILFSLNAFAGITYEKTDISDEYRLASFHNSLFGAPTSNDLIDSVEARKEIIEFYSLGYESRLSIFEVYAIQNCPTVPPENADNDACGTNVNFTPPDTNDPLLTYADLDTPLGPGDFFPVGDNTVTYIERNVGTNTATGEQCSFTVTVIDTQAPTLTGSAYSGSTGINTCQPDTATADANFNAVSAAQGYTDNCGGSVTATRTATNITGNDNAWTVEYTFTVSDANGNDFVGRTYSDTGGDVTAPTLTGSAYTGSTGINTCQPDTATADANFNAVSAAQGYTDNCGAAVTAARTNTNITGNDNAWTVTYTYTVSDANGNDFVGRTYSDTGGDATAPTLTGSAYTGSTGINTCQPDTATADANFNAASAAQGYTDNCGGSVTATRTATNITGNDNAWTVEYTFTVSDANGNDFVGRTYSDTGGDATAPTLTGSAYTGSTGINTCQPDTATADANFNAVSAAQGYTDNCGAAVTAARTNTNITGNDNAWTVTYTYTVSDANGNDFVGRTYSDTGGDATAPTLTGSAYTGSTGINTCQPDTATADANFNAASAAQGYTDNCGGSVTATRTATNITGNDNAWTVEYTFTVSDANGNDFVGRTYSDTGGDATAPTLTGSAYTGSTGINTCQPDTATADANFNAVSAAQGYTDNCGASVTAARTNTNITGNDIAWTVTYTYTVSDENGNGLTGQQYSESGGDDDAPVLTGAAYADPANINGCQPTTAEADAAFDSAKAIQGYTDNCGAAVTAARTNTNMTGNDSAWTVTYTYTVSDENGNGLSGQQYSESGGDLILPIAVCQDITIQLNSSGNATITPDQINNASYDNCGTVNLVSVLPNTFGCNEIGDNTVLLTINDGNGNESTCSATVTVTDASQNANVSISTSQTNFCANVDVPFTSTISNAGSSINYFWYVDDGSGYTQVATTQDYTLPQPLMNGTKVKLAITSNTFACEAESNEVTLTVNSTVDVKTAIQATSEDICDGESITFSTIPSQTLNMGTNPGYEWFKVVGTPDDRNDGDTSNDDDISLGITASYTSNDYSDGDQVYLVMVPGPSVQCPSPLFYQTNPIYITVNELPSVSHAISNTEICSGDSVTLQGSGANSYTWSDEFGNTYNDGDVVPLTQTTEFTVVGTDTNGCDNSAIVTITVNTLPTVDAGPDQQICDTSSFDLSTIATGSDTITYHSTSANANDLTNNGINSTVSPPVGTHTYFVRSHNSSTGCFSIDQVDIAVNPLLTPTFSITGPDEIDICDGSNVTFTIDQSTVQNGGSSPTFEWFVSSRTGVQGIGNQFTVNNLISGDVISATMVADTDICTDGSAVASNNSITVTEYTNIAAPVFPVATGVNLTNICPVESGLVYRVNPDPNVQSYSWNFPNNGSYTLISTNDKGNEITINVGANATPGNITVTATNACGSVSASLPIELNSFGSVDAGPDKYVCAGTTQVQLAGFTNGVIDKANEFDWSATAGNNNSFNWSGNSYGAKLNPTFTIPNSVGPGQTVTITIAASNRVSGTCNSVPIQDTMTIHILPNPTASVAITGTNPICEGESSQATINVTGYPNSPMTVTYNINGGSNQTINATTGLSGSVLPTLDFSSLSSDTTVKVVSIAYNGTGYQTCSRTINSSATLIVNPPVIIDAIADQTVCEDDSASVNANITQGASTGTWTTSGDGTFTPTNGQGLSVTYQPGPNDKTSNPVILTFTTTDADVPCANASETANISIQTAPTIDNVGSAIEVCDAVSPQPISLNGVSLGGSATTGTWSIDPTSTLTGGTFNNNGGNPNNATFTPDANTVGTYTLLLTTNSTGTCGAATATRTVEVFARTAVTIDYLNSDTTVCSDGTANIVAFLSGSAASGSWTSSSGNNAGFGNTTNSSTTYQPNQADINNGIVTLTFQTNDPNGPCGPSSAQIVIDVYEKIIITTQPQNIGVCAGNNAELGVVAVGDIATYTWYKKGTTDTVVGTNSNILNFSPATVNDSGTYYVVIDGIAYNPCTELKSNEITLNVNQTIAITQQPIDLQNCVGDGTNQLTTQIKATGSIRTFDLYKMGETNPIATGLTGNINAGVTTLDYIFTNLQLTDSGDYYFVINGPSNICPPLQSANFTLTVTDNPDPSFAYTETEYCSNEANPIPSITGTGGGTFSSANGNIVFVDNQTGEIDLANSTSDTVIYTIIGVGGCIDQSAQQSIEIDTFVDLSEVTVHGTSNVGTPTTGNGIAVCYDNSNIQLSIVGDYGNAEIIRWEKYDPSVSSDITNDDAWIDIATISETIDTGTLNDSQAFRVVFDSGNCGIQYSEPAFVDVITIEDLEPEPVQASPTEFCIDETSTLSSSVNYGGDVLNQEGGFDQGQLNTNDPDGWLVDGELGKLSASGNAAAKPNNWSVTNDGKTYYGITYNNNNPNPFEDRKKFGIASGYHNTTGTGDKHPIIYDGFNDIFSDPDDQDAYRALYDAAGKNTNQDNNIRITTMETPIFNLTGVDDATFQFFEAFSLMGQESGCKLDENVTASETAPPGAAILEISIDGGQTYSPIPDEYYNTPPDADTGTRTNRTSSVVVGPANTGTDSYQDFNTVSIDLDAYRIYSDLRIRFTFVRNCKSSWAVEGISLPGNNGAALTEWRDQYNNTSTIEPIAGSNSVRYTPGLPGYQHVNVRTIIEGCENPNSIQEVPLTVYNAYAGENINPVPGECGGLVALNAYDNRRTPLQNYVKMNELGIWDGTAFSIMDFDGQTGWDVATSNDIDQNGINGKYTYTPHSGGGGLSAGNYRDFGPTDAIQYWTVNGNREPQWFAPTTAGAIGEEDAYANFIGPEGTHTLVWNVESPNDSGIFCSNPITVTINNCSTLDWDGDNDHVLYGNDHNLNGAFSIEIWVKSGGLEAATTNNGTSTILSKHVSGTNTGYSLDLETNSPSFTIFNGSGNSKVRAPAGYVLGQGGKEIWHHVAVTYDGTTLKIYVDGILADSQPSSGIIVDSSDFMIGAQSNGAGSYTDGTLYKGFLDELRIWNTDLTELQIREMMNQEIVDSGAVTGAITGQAISEGLNWNNLLGYYQMNVTFWDHTPDCIDNPTQGDDVINGYLQDNSGNGVHGRLRLIETQQLEHAPLPYTTQQTGDWDNIASWEYGAVRGFPNDRGFGSTDIDWNIAVFCDDILAEGKARLNAEENNIDYVLLGLVSLAGELTVTDSGTQDENNPGNGLWVTHYLKLNGVIDLIGDSQLVQKAYYPNQTNHPLYGADSELDVSSGGHLERDQQGQLNMNNYNYFSSPVNNINTIINNGPYSVGNVLLDGTDTDSPVPINWTTNSYDSGGGVPISNSARWIYMYPNQIANTYLQWIYLGQNGSDTPGIGFTLKGSGIGQTPGTSLPGIQNYVFKGKPNNADILLPLGAGNQAMVGNPYPSALDLAMFIPDNAGIIEGSIYLWKHFDSNDTHILKDYRGGYAIANLTGGLDPYIPNIDNKTIDLFYISDANEFTKRPGPIVPVGQGFFVTATGGGTINFNNSQRIFYREDGSESEFLRLRAPNVNSGTNSIKRIRIDVQLPNNVIRPLMIGFVDNKNVTDKYDDGYDARTNDAKAPADAFWRVEDENCLIQGVGNFDITKKYPLAIFSENKGLFRIRVRQLENFDEEINVFLYDDLLGTYSRINDISHKFSTDGITEVANRFYIAFQTDEQELEIPKEEIDKISVNYLHDSHEILIKTPSEINVKQIYLVNMIGQTVKSWNATNTTISNEMRIPVTNLSEGNYIIKLQTETVTVNKKVIITQ